LAEDPEDRKREAARLALIGKIRAAARSEVESATKSVVTPDVGLLAKSLNVESGNPGEPGATKSALRVLGDLDGDETPEVVFRWSRIERYKLANPDVGPVPAWVMFLLSWDGAHWRATELTNGEGVSGVETIPGLFPRDAVVVVDGVTARPYPVIFQFQDHSATLSWDSRADESLYQGYAQGSVQFKEREGAPPAMIVTGRADPGVIHFQQGGQRGFDAATVYFWEQGAYVPKRTEFEENEDYTLYRFIAALHLRDFKAAFACIDPAKFLDGTVKSPEALRKEVDDSWPELTGNSIFDAVESGDDKANQFALALEKENVRYVYIPALSSDGKLLLTGMERRTQRQ
jgi:hypothetical protein